MVNLGTISNIFLSLYLLRASNCTAHWRFIFIYLEDSKPESQVENLKIPYRFGFDRCLGLPYHALPAILNKNILNMHYNDVGVTPLPKLMINLFTDAYIRH